MTNINPMNPNNRNVPTPLSGVESMHVSDKETKKKSAEKDKEVKKNEEVLKNRGILGKSQVSKPDSLSSDLNSEKIRNQKLLNAGNLFFEKVYEDLKAKNSKNPYEEACFILKQFEDELS